MIWARAFKRRMTRGRLARLLPDERFLRWKFEQEHGYPPDLASPTSLNEKILWLMLRAPEPLGPRLVDKLAVRAFVEERCGPGLLNELYRVYERVEDIRLADLPDRFVLRVTHVSGRNVICHDKASLDWTAAQKQLRKAMALDYYWTNREPVYRGIPRRITCERYLGDPVRGLPDYKVYCFEGVPRIVHVDMDRFGDHRRALFDPDWKPFPFSLAHDWPRETVPRPRLLGELLERAAQLSRGFPFLRVDLYHLEDRVVFGELTFYPGAALERFFPDSADRELGAMLRLPDRSRS